MSASTLSNVISLPGVASTPAIRNSGLKATVNSDDPAYFGGYVHDNYVDTARALGLSRDELVSLAANSIEASFAGEAERAEWLAELAAIPV